MSRLLIATLTLVVVVFLVFGGKSKMFFPPPGSNNRAIPDLSGKYALVTGSNVGLGYQSCLELMKAGAVCIATARTQDKADKTAKSLNALKLKGRAIGMELALDDHRSIYRFATEFKAKRYPLHILLANAGIMAVQQYESTKDGLESQTGVNFIGHYYLNVLLQGVLESSKPSRVVIVTSAAHALVRNELPEYSVIQGDEIKGDNYYPFWQYGAAKLFNIYHAQEMQERMSLKGLGSEVIFSAAHPGAVRTELVRHLTGKSTFLEKVYDLMTTVFFLDSNTGATTQLYAATVLDGSLVAGKYLAPIARVMNPSIMAQDAKSRKRVIQEADEIISKWEH